MLTVARDEAQMLPRWVRHYGGQVGVQNLIVIDDNSSDGGTDDLPCTVHRIPGFKAARFEAGRIKLVSGLAQGLLQSYDVAVFTDVDEFLIPDPDHHDGLLDYLRHRPDVAVMAPMALNVVHHIRVEADLDPALPVLGQRGFAKFAPVMCKPSVKRVPAPWKYASHGITARYVPDPELFMVHLKFADREALRRVADRRNEMTRVDGRGAHSSWARTGEEMTVMLEEFVGEVDPASVPEFDPRSVDLDQLVIEDRGSFRSQRQGQLLAMKDEPLLRVPRRLHGLV